MFMFTNNISLVNGCWNQRGMSKFLTPFLIFWWDLLFPDNHVECDEMCVKQEVTKDIFVLLGND